MFQTSRGGHAPDRALEPPQTMLNNTARAENPGLPKPGTPQTVLGSTLVPMKKS
ncbi:hypothetical protein JCGZ_12945 [Jatropha curcas]|uniref:Uncharacterized protein n=1 Tax=Jatropha curcas TaxID=180498 RepID=A0A067LDH7_JATCU|nr:hypothetical protein JCGZ_12945 [Jatropha curcas]